MRIPVFSTSLRQRAALPPTNQYTEKFGIVPVLPNIKAESQN